MVVREGGVLCPLLSRSTILCPWLLFTLFISDLQEKVSSLFPPNSGFLRPTFPNSAISDHALYADDLVMLAICKESMQFRLNLLRDYCNEKSLVVNIGKTEVIYFKNTRRSWPNSNLFYDGDELPMTNEFKYLGFWFEKKCLTTLHFDKRVPKLAAAATVFYLIAVKFRMFSPVLLKEYYASLVSSQMFASEFIFYDFSQLDVEKRKFFKRLIGLPQEYSTAILHIVFFDLLESDFHLLANLVEIEKFG
jgi:hypothetical protein